MHLAHLAVPPAVAGPVSCSLVCTNRSTLCISLDFYFSPFLCKIYFILYNSSVVFRQSVKSGVQFCIFSNSPRNNLTRTSFGLGLLFRLDQFPEAALCLGQRDSTSLTLINPVRLPSEMVEISHISPAIRVVSALCSKACQGQAHQSLSNWQCSHFCFHWPLPGCSGGLAFVLTSVLCAVSAGALGGLPVRVEGEDLLEGSGVWRR